MLNPIENKTLEMLYALLTEIEQDFEADVIYINGPISDDLIPYAQEVVERLKNEGKSNTLCVFLTTNGGDVITVERLVNVFRYNYKEVNFVIPDHAYSAGTILCMSGDNIYMDYNSVLGPIDPQVMNKEGRFVPANGYLGKIEGLLEKARNDEISEAEFLILKDFDLAEISLYEQAATLTVDLLKKWLVKYKFKNWDKHASTGEPVSISDKEQRATDIAEELGNYEKWKSHGRPLNIDVLKEIKLVIEDYSEMKELRHRIKEFHALCEDYMGFQGQTGFIFSRR